MVLRIDCVEIRAKSFTKVWLRSPRNHTPEPTPRFLEVPRVVIIEASHEANEEGERGLEWAVVGHNCSKNNEQVKEKTERCEPNDDRSGLVVDSEEVFRKGT